MAGTTAMKAMEMARFGRLHPMGRMADNDEDPYLLKGVKYPGKHDVMLGRGGESTYHCGNIAFRQMVEEHKTKYYTAPRANKSRVVAEVVRKWRCLNPPGRFLTRSQPCAGDQSSWEDVGDRRALKKASHSLRDAVRCFSIEKKQQQRDNEAPSSSSSSSSSPSTEQDEKGSSSSWSSSRAPASDEDDYLEPTMSVHMDRKRGRDNMMEPEFMTSSHNQGKKHWNTIVTSAPAAVDERPCKMRRVVCDEREESQDDCRREGCDDDDDGGRRGDNFCCGRDDDAGRDDFSPRGEEHVPTTISVQQLQQHFASARRPQTFLTSHFTSNTMPEKSSHKGLLKLSAAHRFESNPSPCGSADWFTRGTELFPVRGATATLPPAAVLVREVAAESCHQQNAAAGPLPSLDDDSTGWFSDEELDEQEVPSFRTTVPSPGGPLLHRPLAVTISGAAFSGSSRDRPSQGREL